MGPRHGQRAFLATQSASPRRRAFLELKSPIAGYSATVACKLQKFLDDTQWRGQLPEGRGLDHDVAEAIVRAVKRQQRGRARRELFAYARLQWAEMEGRDLH